MSENQIEITFPLKGEWQLLCPPGHHPFAFDFVKSDVNRKVYSDCNRIKLLISHIPARNYYCWEHPIYSPINGIVLQVGNEWEDNEKINLWKTIALWYNATYKFKPIEVNGRLDIRPNVGNYIMIQAEEGYIVLMAHLRNSSIKVIEGQEVKSGDLIGKVGNSGNSTMPHLHINIFDQMKNPLSANVLPFVFSEYMELNKDKKWEKHALGVPEIKSFIRNAE